MVTRKDGVGVSRGKIGTSQFWKERQAEFLQYAERFSLLRALWKGDFQRWRLWWGNKTEGLHVPSECERILDAIATKAVLGFEGTRSQTVEPRRDWLDCLRHSGLAFRVTGRTVCTEFEWDAGVRDGKPLVDVRRELGYTTGDEWKKVYRRRDDGELEQLTQEELKALTTEELARHYQRIEDGEIQDVFRASADFCETLSAKALQLESRRTRFSQLVAEWKTVKQAPIDLKLLELIPQFESLAHGAPVGFYFHVDFLGGCLCDDSLGFGLKFDSLAAEAGKILGRIANVSRTSEKEWADFWKFCLWFYLRENGKGFLMIGGDDREGGMVRSDVSEPCSPVSQSANIIRWLKLNGGVTESAKETLKIDPVRSAFDEAGKVKKKRGRPAVISDEQKRKALLAKASGHTNKDAAKILYNKRIPTSQEVRNVSSVLRHFKGKMDEDPSRHAKRSPQKDGDE